VHAAHDAVRAEHAQAIFFVDPGEEVVAEERLGDLLRAVGPLPHLRLLRHHHVDAPLVEAGFALLFGPGPGVENAPDAVVVGGGAHDAGDRWG
jgi:hypothetical protein